MKSDRSILDVHCFLSNEDVPKVLSGWAGKLRTASYESPLPEAQLETDEMIVWAAEHVGLFLERTAVGIEEYPRNMRRMLPALVHIPGKGLLAIEQTKGSGKVVLRLANGTRTTVKAKHISNVLRQNIGAGQLPTLSPQVSEAARNDLRKLLLADENVEVWVVRPAPQSGFANQLRQVRPVRLVLLLVLFSVLQQVLTIGSWLILGLFSLGLLSSPLQVTGWYLMTLVHLPLGAGAAWLTGKAVLELGVHFRQFLFTGATQIPSDTIRRLGTADIIARVQQFESVATQIVTLPVVAGDMLFSILAAGAAIIAVQLSIVFPVIFLAAILLIVLTGIFAIRAFGPVLRSYLELTGDLVESVTGYLTKRVQGKTGVELRRQEGMLLEYHASLRTAIRLFAVCRWLPYLFFAASILAMFLPLERETTTSLALAVGSIMLGVRALQGLAEFILMLAPAPLAIEKLGLIYRSTTHEAPAKPSIPLSKSLSEYEHGTPIVNLSGVRHAYEGRSEEVLRGIDLELISGEKYILRGRSGGGKSTLASIIAGQRAPREGVVLAGGLDHDVLGVRGWARIVALAPQFYQNHVFEGSLIFNLVLGRRWPPSAEDAAEARLLCNQLGLQPLIDRMPSKLLEIVGPNGWQLSHGEKNRLFLARTILSEAPVIILDESVSALDPESVGQVIEFLEQSDRTVVLLAHP